MTKEDKGLGFYSFLALWFGAAISIAEIMTGGLLAPLGFKKGLLIIILGHIVGTTILVLGGIIGYEKKVPAMESTRISFGLYGSHMFSILNILQLIGWTAVMIISGGRSLNIVSKTLWNFDSISFWSILIGILICLWIYLGTVGLEKLNVIAASLLFGLTLVLSFVIFKESSLFSKEVQGTISFGGAMELNVIMPLSWLPLIADYTRQGKSKKSSILGSWIGYFVGSSWMYIIGLGSAIVSGNTDIGAIMIAANLGFLALGILALSTVTTTFLDAYSAGITTLNILPKLNEKNSAVFMGIIGTIIALVFPIEQYENFLYAIGSVFAPLFAVLYTDYFIIKKNREIEENVLINWGATIVWALGVMLYYILIKYDLILGTTVPVMIIISIVYTITWRWTVKWKLIRKS